VRVAFVAPFFGARAAGGAEAECRKTAMHLAAAGLEIDILTTCSLDLHHDWNVHYYREGTTREDGLTVHRFRTECRGQADFHSLNARLIAGETLSAEQQLQFMAMHVNSPGLYETLAGTCDRYDWVCFIPYLFGTTIFGSRICPDKAVLIPCLHDEGYARMQLVAEVFRRVDRIVFHTGSEQEQALGQYGIPREKCILLGEGIDTDYPADAARFRKKYGIDGPFILYAGRKDATKNVPRLLSYFLAFLQRHSVDLKLVLVGPASITIPRTPKDAVVDLGFIPEQDKRDAHAAAAIMCQPSLNESFSIVIMESWMCGVPCLVHGDCAVTREHVVRAGGGLYFRSFAEFDKCVQYLLQNPDTARQMGRAGRRYVEENFAWDRIVERYKSEVFGKGSVLTAPTSAPAP